MNAQFKKDTAKKLRDNLSTQNKEGLIKQF